MNTTITLGEAGLLVLGLALLVLIFYCISFVRNLLPVVKNMNRILEDTQVVSSIAAENAKHVEKVVGDVSSSVGGMCEAIRGNQSVVAALTSLVNAITALNNLFGRKKNSH